MDLTNRITVRTSKNFHSSTEAQTGDRRSMAEANASVRFFCEPVEDKKNNI
jgi:hypothetical protein